MTSPAAQRECTWCGAPVDAASGYRAAEPAGARVATFCRLEHVVPWEINGAHWEPDDDVSGIDGALLERSGLDRCSQCGEPVGDRAVVLVLHLVEHRIVDAFFGMGHAAVCTRADRRWALTAPDL